MKIAMIQCNVMNGAMSANAAMLADACSKAHETGCGLCVAPFETLAGPQPERFAMFPDFEGKCREALDYLTDTLADGPALLCGHPQCRHSAILIADGLRMLVSPTFFFRGLRLGIETPDGTQSPEELDISFQLHALPFAPGLQLEREKLAAAAGAETRSWRFTVNLVGGYESHIYNGQSFAVAPGGAIMARGKAFQEDRVIVDTGCRDSGRTDPLCASTEEAQWQALVLGTGDFVRKAGACGAILGLSGGIDSALVACIATEALGPEHVSGVLMPSPYTSEASIRDALALAEALGIATFTLPIENLMLSFEETLKPVLDQFPPGTGDLTFENIQARIRGVLLMAAANRSGALVLNTGNKSELAMGYCTLYGDTAGAVAVIGDLFKSRVYELAAWYCSRSPRGIIPANIFDKAPSAELRPDQKDTDSLPPYRDLDPVLASLLSGKVDAEAEPAILGSVEQKMLASSFKSRQCPPPLLVSGLPLHRHN